MTHQTASARQGRFRFRYFVEIVNELKKVVWLTRREATYLTGMVIIVSAFFALVLGGLDYIFSKLITLFIGG